MVKVDSKKLKNIWERNKQTITVVAAALLLTIALLAVRAGAPFVAFEAEGALLSGNSVVKTGSSVSNGEYVEFNSDSTATPCDGVQVNAEANLYQVTQNNPAGTTFCLPVGTVYVPNEITAQDGDKFIGAGRTKSFIVGTGAQNLIVAASQANVEVRSLDISGGVGDSSCAANCGRAMKGSGSSWHIEDIRCHDNMNQCIGSGNAKITFINNECDNNGFGAAFLAKEKRSSSCIKRVRQGAELTVKNSYIHDNAWIGVWCDYCENGPFVIENNTISNNGKAAVSWEVSGGWASNNTATIRGNTMQNNGHSSASNIKPTTVTCNGCANLTVENNIFGGNEHVLHLVNSGRGSWGDIYAVTVRDNTLNGDALDCSLAGVSCSNNN